MTLHTPLAGWSLGKSVIATLMGVLVQAGVYQVDQPAPVPQWQAPGDPRQTITIAELLNMSSGLRMRAPQDPASRSNCRSRPIPITCPEPAGRRR